MKIEILLIEDSPGDVILTRELLREARIPTHLSVATHGEEAMEFLTREGRFIHAPRPDLIILDLNMPRMDGREVLAKIKSNGDLRDIPVTILTTSSAQEDIAKSYGLHANCFITKPIDLDQFVRVMKSFEEFWMQTAQLPRRPTRGQTGT